ncbi:MAG TPA: hypothetical protein VGY56_15670 [Verrucomicrobiae bacterium]|nr:hypothetical protein [Verrucomicrobiae bacterium]
MTGNYSARRAALGGRTIKTGQSRWFVGYKKHTLRVWLNRRSDQVLLVPVVSWAAPANRGEVLFLWPSLQYCAQWLHWLPDIVVGDMGYISLEEQRKIRERLGVTVITKLRPDMKLIAPFEPGPVAVCPQGQVLTWLGLERRDQLHWFGVTAVDPLCERCWEQSHCARQFSYQPSAHEILFGQIPLASSVAKILLEKVRPWIEPAQSYEKNQLGLSQMFLNNLQLTWAVCLLADAAVLLRAHAMLMRPTCLPALHALFPNQLSLDLD